MRERVTVDAKDCRPPSAPGGSALRGRPGAAVDMRRRRGRERRGGAAAAGFTYLGVLMLILMMGIAAALVSELWQTAQKRDKEQELLFVGNQFRRALAMYSANGGAYPSRLQDLLLDPRLPGVRRYLRKIYRDPITGGTDWGLVKSGGEFITGVYSLSGEEPLKKTEFSLADREFEGKKKYSDWVFTPSKPAQPAPGTAAAPQGTRGAATPAPPQGTPGAATPAVAGPTQNDATLNRPQSRVRR